MKRKLFQLFTLGLFSISTQVCAQLSEFKAKYLIAVSDADMVPSAYSNGLLGPAEGFDALSIINMKGHPSEWTTTAINVSNSVTGPPAVLSITPDGHYAIVIETLKQRKDSNGDVKKLSDLKPGSLITVVDISNGTAKAGQKIDAPGIPLTISTNAEGTLVAVTLQPQGVGEKTPLLLYRFANGKLSAPSLPEIPGWKSGDVLYDASFHPKENTLALVNQTGRELSFVRVNNTPSMSVETWGNKIQIDRGPFIVRFSPDGRFVFVCGTYTGTDSPTPYAKGAMNAIRYTESKKADGKPVHHMVSRAQTGSVPEGFAISPDGQFIVTTNLEESARTFEDPKFTPYATISLLKFDAGSGILTHIDDYPFEGLLPESVVFDNTSHMIAVTSFSHIDPKLKGGTIDFWKLEHDPALPSSVFLVKTRNSVPLNRGVHNLDIVR